jgi:hypothetical protein
MSRKLVFIILFAMATPAPLRAGDVDSTLAQKNGWAAYQTEINRITGDVNAKCGSSLRASYDKSTYPRFDPIQDRTQAACQAAVGTLAALCANDAGKQAVQALIAANCRFSQTGTRATRSGSTLIIDIDPERSSIVGAEAGSYSWASALREVL